MHIEVRWRVVTRADQSAWREGPAVSQHRREAGYEAIVDELQHLRDDHQYWIEYALDQLQTVQQVATRFDGRDAQHPAAIS